jgi:hypothetical protein
MSTARASARSLFPRRRPNRRRAAPPLVDVAAQNFPFRGGRKRRIGLA